MVLLVARLNCETSPRDFIVLANSIPIPKNVFALDKYSLDLFIKNKGPSFWRQQGLRDLKDQLLTKPQVQQYGQEEGPKFSL